MSDDDVVRDARGRIVKGSPGLHRKPDNQEPSPDTDALPALDTSFDDDLVAASESFGKPRAKTGRKAYCEWLRDQRPVDFSALLRPALARKAKSSTSATGGGPGVIINILPVAKGISAGGDTLVSDAIAKASWEKRSGMTLTFDEPPSPPPSDDEQSPEPSKPYALMSGPELAAAPTNNEITFGGSDDEPEQPSPRRSDRGIDMDDLLRSIPKPKWTKPRW